MFRKVIKGVGLREHVIPKSVRQHHIHQVPANPSIGGSYRDQVRLDAEPLQPALPGGGAGNESFLQ